METGKLRNRFKKRSRNDRRLKIHKKLQKGTTGERRAVRLVPGWRKESMDVKHQD
jgi:hypothetical protein